MEKSSPRWFRYSMVGSFQNHSVLSGHPEKSSPAENRIEFSWPSWSCRTWVVR
ncbi:hypothetical protein [Georgenia sp. SUBG003]|uniref:hypothetical protein n=1 Tax=Georgenia sp. SUBG003 TaxID=1497974 RepID=UPI003AB8100C